jgi:hypothetical protein
VVALLTVPVRLAGASGVGGELGQQALAVPLADAGRSGQAGPGRGLAGCNLGVVGRPDSGTSVRLCSIRPVRLGCGVVARPVRGCGLGAGLLLGPRCGWSGYRPSPPDLLHEQVRGEDQGDGAMANTSWATGRSGAWAMLKATEAAENSPASVHG